MRGSSWKSTGTLALAATLPFVALACGGGEQGEQMEQQPAQQQQQMQSSAQTASSSFQPENGSNVTGDVQFTRNGDSLTVDISAHMGNPGDYAAHIHNGTCDDFGSVVAPLGNATAAEPGIAETSTTVDATQLQAGNPYVVMIHDQQGAPAGCAPVPASIVSGGGM